MIRTVKGTERFIEYELMRTPRKSMEIRVVAKGKVRVFAPTRARLKDVDAFVLSRGGWIDEAMKQMRDYAKRHESEHPMENGAPLLIEGRRAAMRIVFSKTAKVAEENEEVIIFAPDGSPDAVRAQLKGYLVERARRRIVERLAYFTPLIGRAPNRIAIRDQKTRWGSCSSGDNLNFNYKLIMAPPEALDYVVVHELCHLYEFNHSDRFWRRVAQYLPDYLVWKRWLKENGKLLGV